MDSIITQVSQDRPSGSSSRQAKTGFNGGCYEGLEGRSGLASYEGSLIHLNIQETHYFITRAQLMSLPESLLLCLFPSGVFMDRYGHVITELTPEDEVYVAEFSPSCFEYIMEVYSRAHDDLALHPIDKLFPLAKEHSFTSLARGIFGFSAPNEADILHRHPVIIVLREDLDYYCVPQHGKLTGDELDNLMVQVKLAAGSYLTSNRFIFAGLTHGEKVGGAEQHLMDMLCSSGFHRDSQWGNRQQEPGKTVITSLMLCRLMNETTQEFRDQYTAAKKHYELVNDPQTCIPPLSLTRSVSYTTKKDSKTNLQTLTASTSHPALNNNNTTPPQSRKSRFSRLTDNVRSRSSSKQRKETIPRVYDLVPKPEINEKLLLFWRQPARKCWWTDEQVDLEVQFPTATKIPVKLHTRRVWTLELSVVGAE